MYKDTRAKETSCTRHTGAKVTSCTKTQELK